MAAPLLEVVSGLITKFRGPTYLARLNREMHANGAFPGQSWRAQLEALARFVPDLEHKTILDFGCGPLGGLRQHFGDRVIPHDPFVDAYSAAPWSSPFDVVFSSDVLEHMRLADIVSFLEQVSRSSARYVFLNISTRRAYKPLPNRANTHLTIRPAHWWLETITKALGPQFAPKLAEADLLRDEGTFCFERGDGGRTGGEAVR